MKSKTEHFRYSYTKYSTLNAFLINNNCPVEEGWWPFGSASGGVVHGSYRAQV